MVVMSSKLCYSGSLDVSTISIGNNVQNHKITEDLCTLCEVSIELCSFYVFH